MTHPNYQCAPAKSLFANSDEAQVEKGPFQEIQMSAALNWGATLTHLPDSAQCSINAAPVFFAHRWR